MTLIPKVKEEDFCNVTCSGDDNYLCGGLIAISIYVASEYLSR